MMKRVLLPALMALALVLPATAQAAPEIGRPAPAFTGTDSHGVNHNLADFKGKTVVLEWTNEGCPYVHKHYDSGHMQALQEKATGDGVIWLTVVSSAEGKQGFMSPDEANALIEKQHSHETARILDPSGEIGSLYGAKTTPHMFVIDPAGTLVYMGAIDDRPTTDPASLDGATNYVEAALQAVKAGTPVATPMTQPYGCGVKYDGQM
jgi:peroxiredoxin